MARRKNLSFSFSFLFLFLFVSTSISIGDRSEEENHSHWSPFRQNFIGDTQIEGTSEQKIQRMPLSLSSASPRQRFEEVKSFFLPACLPELCTIIMPRKRERTQRMSCVCLIRLLTPNTRTKLQSLLFDTQKRQRAREEKHERGFELRTRFNSVRFLFNFH